MEVTWESQMESANLCRSVSLSVNQMKDLFTSVEPQYPPGKGSLEEEEEEPAWAEEMVPSKSNPSYFFVDQKNFYAKGISNAFKTESRNESEMPNVCFFSTF